MKFHHIGYATHSIDSELNEFSRLGYSKIGKNFCDTIQGVKGCFIEGNGPRIELLENLLERDTLTPWLSAGTKAYHFAYLVSDIKKTIKILEGSRARPITDIAPSIAFNNAAICFVMLRNRQLIELVEIQN